LARLAAATIVGWLCVLDVSRGAEIGSAIEVWQRRQAAIRAFDFSWSGLQFQAKGADPALSVLDAMAGNVPPSDMSFEIRMRFVVDTTGRVRLEYNGRAWSQERGDYVAKATINVFDGRRLESFFPPGRRPFPRFFVEGETISDMARDARVRPIRMVYRPFDATMGLFDPSRLRFTDQEAFVDGRRCLVMEHSGDDFMDVIYVDAERQFLPVRYYRHEAGMTREQIEISYCRDQVYGWVPTAWNVAHLDDRGAVRISWSGNVTEYALNQPVPDEVFEIALPPGTWVRNYITGECYILREGGEKRPILPGEYTGDNYEELLRSDPMSGEGKLRWFLGAVVVAVGALAAWAVLRRRKIA